MSEPSIYFEDVNERQGEFHRRAFLLGGATAFGLLALGGRLAQLQVVEADYYRTRATKNQFNFRLITPPRGRILDRNGVVLAGNRPSFRVLVSRDETKDLDATIDALIRLLPDISDRRRSLIREISRSPRFVPVPVASDLDWEQFARVNLYASEIPGVTAEMNEARVYPFGGAFAHVIGYVAKVSAKDLEKAGENPDPILHNPGFRIGKQGLEKALDLDLRGRAGTHKVEVDAKGRLVGEDVRDSQPPVAGKEVVLTLDADIQNRALEVLGEDSGAAVVIDIQSGELLCLASTPSFDANMFVSGVPAEIYRALADYERRPLLDKALSGLYPPGSTFKPMTALAALGAGINPKRKVLCTGTHTIGNTTMSCWKKDGHGWVDMHDAIKYSCDVYFYEIAPEVGPDRIAKVARSFGLGQEFDIGIQGQKKGIVPDLKWKQEYAAMMRARGYKADGHWYPGETLSYAIGQGALQTNALQLAVMVARLANGRKALHPRLIKSVGGKSFDPKAEETDLNFPIEHMDLVRAGMASVANDTTGTAYRASQLNLGDLAMAGKTGTAQVRNISKAERARGVRKNESLPWKLRDHGLFVAFAPHDAPRYALSVIIQHGMGGAKFAAPKAREIMRAVLIKDPDLRERIQRKAVAVQATSVDPGLEPDVYEGDVGPLTPAKAPPAPEGLVTGPKTPPKPTSGSEPR